MQSREEALEIQENLRTGISLSYTVEEQEIYRFVKHMSLFQLEGTQALLLIALPLLFSLGCIGIGIFSQNLEFFLFAAAMFCSCGDPVSQSFAQDSPRGERSRFRLGEPPDFPENLSETYYCGSKVLTDGHTTGWNGVAQMLQPDDCVLFPNGRPD